jgi:hypothetical protein
MKNINTSYHRVVGTILFGVIIAACSMEKKLTPEQAREIAKEAYVYGFPIVMNTKQCITTH